MSSADPSRREENAAALRQKWQAVALSNGPGDREAAQAAARILYRRAGRRPPVGFVWLDSPLEGIVTATVLRHLEQGRHLRRFMGELRDEIFSDLNPRGSENPPPEADLEPLRVLCTRAIRIVGGRLRQMFQARRVWVRWEEYPREVEVGPEALTAERLMDEIFAPLREKLLQRPPPTLKGANWRRLLEPLGSGHYAELFTRDVGFADMPGGNLDRFGFGTLDAWRLALCEHAFAERGEGDAAVLAALSELSRQCGWWWPLRRLVVFTKRPSVISCDDAGRPHALDGPALAYADGWQFYAWRGMEVPEEIIAKREQLTVADIEDEYNVELRRAMMEVYGQERFLLDSGAQAVHEDEFGTLYWLEVWNDEPLVMVKVRNSTPEPDGTFKDYFLRVPPHIETAREAVAWTFGLEASDYDPSVQT